ncbi:MAG: hypothetical protein HQL28_06440, partial [Candidatus Omnitrophica bacterium]|nr:hypothetical protein [Candidatus Omnitrophota bacterium]
EHVDQVIHELMDASSAKLLYQDTILHDALECRTPAAPRMAELIGKMIEIGRDARRSGQALLFPAELMVNTCGHHLPEEKFDLAKLYPGHKTFSQMDKVEMQSEIGNLRRDMARSEAWAREFMRSFEYRLAERLLKLKKKMMFRRPK